MSISRLLFAAAIATFAFAMGATMLLILLTNGFNSSDSVFRRLVLALGGILFVIIPPYVLYKLAVTASKRMFIEVNEQGITYQNWPWKQVKWSDVDHIEAFVFRSHRHIKIFLLDAERFYREHPLAEEYGRYKSPFVELRLPNRRNFDVLDVEKKTNEATKANQAIMADLSFISGSMAGLERALAKAAAHHVPHRTIRISGY